MADNEDLLELILAIRTAPEGERERLFETLDRRVRPWSSRFFYKKGFSSEEIEDLTQEAMVRVYNGLRDFRGDASVKVWIFEILSNVFRNEIRRRHSAKRDGAEVSLSSTGGFDAEGGAEGADLDLPATEQNPLDELLEGEGSERFRRALLELPTQMRRVCLLRYEHGMKYKEIAAVLGISIETVKAHLHQAKKRLGEILGDDERPPAPDT